MSNKSYGCGSHSCYLQKPLGIGNNGPCECFTGVDIEQRRRILDYIDFLRDEIRSYVYELEQYQEQDPSDSEDVIGYNTNGYA